MSRFVSFVEELMHGWAWLWTPEQQRTADPDPDRRAGQDDSSEHREMIIDAMSGISLVRLPDHRGPREI